MRNGQVTGRCAKMCGICNGETAPSQRPGTLKLCSAHACMPFRTPTTPKERLCCALVCVFPMAARLVVSATLQHEQAHHSKAHSAARGLAQRVQVI